jgi:hypothetical protein
MGAGNSGDVLHERMRLDAPTSVADGVLDA